MHEGTFNDTKNLRDKRVTVIDKNLEIYGACQPKTTFYWYCLRPNDPVLTGECVIL